MDLEPQALPRRFVVIDLILYILAAIAFLFAALGVTTARVHLGWLGLFFFMLSFIF